MSWSQIAEDEVLQEFNPQEQAQIAKIQGAADNLAPILARVVNAARGCVVAGGGQVDQADGSIPDQLRNDVIDIARWRWLVALPDVNAALQSKNRKDANDAAEKRLDDVAAGKIKIELPAAPISQNAPVNGIQVASKQHRRFKRHQMEGL